MSEGVDMFMSHEWPTVITQRARKDQVQNLLRFKKHFQQDVSQGRLGSRGFSEILDEVRPKFWFSAHLHVKFQAFIDNSTEFLALDKPLPKRQYLDVFHIEKETLRLQSVFIQNYQRNNYQNQKQYQQQWVKKGSTQQQIDRQVEDKYQSQLDQEEEKEQFNSNQTPSIAQNLIIEYDKEWIAILQATQNIIPLQNQNYNFLNLNKSNAEIMNQIQTNLEALKDKQLQINFVREDLYKPYKNNMHPSTEKFIKTFNLDDRLFNPEKYLQELISQQAQNTSQINDSQNKKDLEETKDNQNDFDIQQEVKLGQRSFEQAFQKVNDQNEIDLDDLE